MGKRQSNFELLRIICILFIIALHIIGQSEIVKYNSITRLVFFTYMRSFGRIACSIFVMIGAWFLIDSTFKMERILRLWFTVLVYVLPVTLFCKYGLNIVVDYEEMFKCFFPISRAPLWFVGYYILLLLEAPFLNIILKNSSKSKLLGLLIVWGIIMIGFSTLTCRDGIMGHSLTWFPYLYLVIGYIKIYSGKIFEKQSINVFLGGGIYFILCSLLMIIRVVDKYDIVRKYLNYYTSTFWTIPNFLCALGVFFFFKNLKMPYNKWVNLAASTTLGVYIIHQIPVFYPFLWNGIFRAKEHKGSIIYTLFMIGTTFVGAMVIELIIDRCLLPLVVKPFREK